MTAQQLAALCLRIRSLFRGELEEDIFALHVRWMKDRDFSVCSDAVDRYALDFGGERGRFIPAKFREYHDSEVAKASERRRHASGEQARRAMNLGLTGVDIEWVRIRKEAMSLEQSEIDAAVGYLESLGWQRPTEPMEQWPRTWVLAVLDLAAGREVHGLPARSFWARAVPQRRPAAKPARKP